MMYTSLNDAQSLYGELAPGTTEVWYQKGFGGYTKPDPRDLAATHALLGRVRETSPERLFIVLQGEYWSPNGEARDLIKALGLKHTSMSVGDVLVIGGIAYRCDLVGWSPLWPGPHPIPPFWSEGKRKQEAAASVLDVLQKIVDEGQYNTVKFDDGDRATIDGYTASAIITVYNALNEDNKLKFQGMLQKSLDSFERARDFSFQQVRAARWG